MSRDASSLGGVRVTHTCSHKLDETRNITRESSRFEITDLCYISIDLHRKVMAINNRIACRTSMFGLNAAAPVAPELNIATN